MSVRPPCPTLPWRTSALVGLLLLACGPAAATPSGQGHAGEGQGAPAPKHLTIAVENEPEFLAPGIGDTSANKAASNLRLALSQRLATYDDRGDLRPLLATELPSQDRGTWIVRPDGSMQTTYRLWPGVTWHDGAALTPRDFVFGWTVFADPDLGQTVPPAAKLISRIDVTDDLALAIEWTKTYPTAHGLVSEEVGPLPAHLLESTYRAEKDRLLQLPYWSHQFTGLGPYQLAEWERGSHLVLRAYDRFYAGRAKIDAITVRFIPNAPTAVANLLAGTVDGVLPRTLDFTQAMFVKREWEQAGKKPVFLPQPTHWRKLFVQLRDPKPPEIRDVRVRRGLLHALDRQAIVDTLLDGQSPVSDTFLPPNDVKWEWVKDAITRYEYDPRRGQDLLAEAGWRRGSDGALANSAGERVTLALWTTSGAQTEREQSIIADYWRSAGLVVDQHVLTQAQDRDRQFRASFPAFDGSQIPLRIDTILQRLHSSGCPTEATRWAGNNRGCWSNPAADGLNEALSIAIEPSEQRRLYRDLARLVSTELPVLPLYFSVQVVIFREGITGVKGDTRPSGSETWNVAEWDLR